MRFLAVLLFCLILPAAAHAQAGTGFAPAGETGFAQWLYGFKQRAVAQGLPMQFLNDALTGTDFVPRVIELDQKQPEDKATQTFAKYRKGAVSDKRIADGRDRLHEYWPLLNEIGISFGVPPQYIVALWGIETNYGRITGGFDTLSALATLAYEGRRADFFETELINALKIQAGGHSGMDRITGSWAGAMGQCQFMPSSYLKYAVDFDGDGHANIWTSMPDIFASIANYLRTEGWNKDLRWGREVRVPATISDAEIGRDKPQLLTYWLQRGVTSADVTRLNLPSDGTNPMASIVMPDGRDGPAYLVYGNYNVIMHWNRSTYFATSVGLLADAIASGNQ